MNKTELFSSKEKQVVYPERPLQGFSTFIVEELPQLLRHFKRGAVTGEELVSLSEQQLAKLDFDSIQEYIQQAKQPHRGFGEYPFHRKLDLASLDLKMLEAALAQLQLPIPPLLSELVDQTSAAAKQLPTLTYEDLIYVNPKSDMRTFTTGEVGASESDFYKGHSLIEQSLERSIDFVRAALFSLQHGYQERIAGQLDLAVQFFESTLKYMQDIGLSMNKSHFAEFRAYLTTHPVRDLKGPSGAFTPSIPVLDMLIGGENIDQTYYQYLAENFSYYPRKGQQDMAVAFSDVRKGVTLNAMIHQADDHSAAEKVETLSNLIRQFRGMHYKGVKHQVPEAVAGKVAGTGGEADPGKFLRERMKIQHIT